MYLEHFGLNEPPFRITPHTEFFFEGANRGATLEALIYAITHDEGITKVSGEVGSGKTMLCRVLMERLPEPVDIIYLANPSLSRAEILHAIADDLKILVKGSRATLILRALQEHLIEMYGQGRRVVVLIDEAHAMPAETLEEIRLLSNLESNRHKLLQIVLFGQPELDDTLGTPHMRQLRERITHSFKLEPLVRADVAAYVNFRMAAAGYRGADAFSSSALRKIAVSSEGLTRRINILADKALLAAFSENTRNVTVKHVKAAIRDSEFSGINSLGRKRVLVMFGGLILLVGILLGAVIALLNVHIQSPSAMVQTEPFDSSASLPPPATEIVMPAKEPQKKSVQEAPATTAAKLLIAPPPNPKAKMPVAVPIAVIKPSGTVALPAKQAESEPAKTTEPVTIQPVAGESIGALADARIASTRAWLQQSPPEEVTLQVAFITSTNARTGQVESFLRYMQTLGLLEQVHVFQTKTKRVPGYSLTFGSYASREVAAKAISGLPAILKSSKPVLRTVKGIRAEIAR